MSVNRRCLCAVGLLALGFGTVTHLGAAPEGGELEVTIEYKGAGKVDADDSMRMP